MALRPVVLASAAILKDPALREKYGAKARGYLKLAEATFHKWDARGCWRRTKAGGVWVVPEFGIDSKTGGWTSGYAQRETTGFTNPANKENLIAEWELALYDATHRSEYLDRARLWWQEMKSRMRVDAKTGHLVWDYWDPAGPWDHKPDGSTRHWVGVHPNGGYYEIDVDAMVLAYEHGVVFTRADLDALIATNRDFMWDQKVRGATFQRIDGGTPDDRWKNSPGLLWTALIPYDAKLREVFEANFAPASWGGLSTTPWAVWRLRSKVEVGMEDEGAGEQAGLAQGGL